MAVHVDHPGQDAPARDVDRGHALRNGLVRPDRGDASSAHDDRALRSRRRRGPVDHGPADEREVGRRRPPRVLCSGGRLDGEDQRDHEAGEAPRRLRGDHGDGAHEDSRSKRTTGGEALAGALRSAPAAPYPGRPMTQPRLTNYWDYIKVEELLALQGGLERDDREVGNDEVVFIVVHQVYELWFKLILRELRTARDLFCAPRVA